MKDLYYAIVVLIPVLAAFARLTWWMADIQARLIAIEHRLTEDARLRREGGAP